MDTVWIIAAAFIVFSCFFLGLDNNFWINIPLSIVPSLLISYILLKEITWDSVIKVSIVWCTIASIFGYTDRLQFFSRRKTQLTCPDTTNWREGFEAYEAGRHHLAKNSYEVALHHFDRALQSGFSTCELFSERAMCLQALGWHIDAIDDYTRAIELEPSDCNTYFQRAMSKTAIGDTHGFVEDVNNAIRLSKINSALNRAYNELARESGHTAVSDIYEFQLRVACSTPERVQKQRSDVAKERGRRSTAESIKNEGSNRIIS